MLYKSNLLSQASGAIAGTVASHNAGGMYMRNRSIPTDPRTSYQTVVRNALATLSTRWSQVLTDTQRAGWAVFASNVPRTNRLGDGIIVSALSWYVAANAPRIQAGVAVVDDGPTTFVLGNLTQPIYTALAGVSSFAYTNTDEWANAAGGYLFTYISRPVSPSINFFKGPYRYAGKAIGAATPPTSPLNITPGVPFEFAPGQKIFWRAVASLADGRPSNVWSGSSIALA